MLNLIIAGILAYLIGSVAFGIVLPKIMGRTRDVRDEWSGNVGATNVLRVHGKLLAVMVLIADMLKGVIAASIGLALGDTTGGAIAGICVMLGHCYPVFYRFKGGKAVATGAGIVLVLFWRAILIILPFYLIVAVISRMASLASVLSALSLVICAIAFHLQWQLAVYCVLAATLVIWKHKANIKRIIAGTENKIGANKA